MNNLHKIDLHVHMYSSTYYCKAGNVLGSRNIIHQHSQEFAEAINNFFTHTHPSKRDGFLLKGTF